MIKVSDARLYSEEGFLLADAVLTRTGPLGYTREELGLDGDPDAVVQLNRSREMLEQSLPKMIGAAVTKGHPWPFITAKDAKQRAEVIGAVVTEPKIDNDGNVRAKIRLYDESAIKGIECGDDQLSPGFNLVMKQTGRDTGEITDMSVNHVAIVAQGRAGSAVRVLDQLPKQETSKMAEDNTNVLDAVRQAMDEALAKNSKNSDPKPVIDGVLKAIEPRLKVIDEMQAAKAKADADAAAKQVADEAKEVRDKLIEEVTAAERARYAVITDALPFIAEDKHGELVNMTTKDVLVMAVGDSVPNASDLTEDVLKGVMLGMSVQAKANDEASGIVRREPQEQAKVVDLYKDRYDNRMKTVKEVG